MCGRLRETLVLLAVQLHRFGVRLCSRPNVRAVRLGGVFHPAIFGPVSLDTSRMVCA